MDDFDSPVCRAESVADRGTIIRASVVHKNNLYFAQALISYTVHAFFQIGFHIINRNYD